MVGIKFLGVLIVYRDLSSNPIGEADGTILKTAAKLGALALSVAQAEEAAARQENELKIRAEIGRDFFDLSQTASNLEAESLPRIASKNSLLLTSIMKKASEWLRSEVGGLFLADEPVCIQSTDEINRDPQWFAGRREFTLRAAVGYPPATIDCLRYVNGEKGLTPTVLKACKPMRVKDVQKHPEWSGKLLESHTGLRSWLGVPLIIRECASSYLLGTLSFGRLRVRPGDALYFSENDEENAKNVADRMALALYTLTVQEQKVKSLASEFAVSIIHNSQQEIQLLASLLDG
jgi:GAF domain-containing protein